MAQFDVFVNPAPRARAAYPFVVSLQSVAASGTFEQIVAPLVPRQRIGTGAGRLTPVVHFDDGDFVVLTPALGRVRSADLAIRHNSIASARGDLLAAIDYLFFGI
jgi:toxin CcdB